MPDGAIQRMRVAATSALAAHEMARPDASILGIFGSGWQAGGHIAALCRVRHIHEVRIYGPTRANREKFAREMQKIVSASVHPEDHPEDVAVGADILVAATNAITPVIQAEWVKRGMHISLRFGFGIDE